ncbi:pimeloyl-ACP methyl ester carboxylesterase [Salinibacterium sp. CAN_S4]|uniref:alpha/beta fold hydrolase n=1 Tax=Salinibacterium sp. CAN_S4 TaxID=2787727 RepID=UPI0018F01579
MRILEHHSSRIVVHASAPTDALASVVLWLGGTPHTGALLQPVVAAGTSVARDIVSIARAGYGGAPRHEGRNVADAADEIVQVLDLLDLDDVIVAGFSGGGPHAIAVGAARPQRTRAVLTFGCIAPYGTTDEWFAGMADPSGLQAAAKGLNARTAHPDEFDPSSFIPADHAALEGTWRDLVLDTQASDLYGPSGAIDDDMAFVRPWGFSLDECTTPVVLLHGQKDRIVPVRHANVIAERLPRATVSIHPNEGHVSILRSLDTELRKIAKDG